MNSKLKKKMDLGAALLAPPIGGTIVNSILKDRAAYMTKLRAGKILKTVNGQSGGSQS